MASLQAAIDLAERGLVPTPALRLGIRAIVARRLREEGARRRPLDAWIDELRQSPVAIQTAAANAQHYEVPPAFLPWCSVRTSNTAARSGRRASPR